MQSTNAKDKWREKKVFDCLQLFELILLHFRPLNEVSSKENYSKLLDFSLQLQKNIFFSISIVGLPCRFFEAHRLRSTGINNFYDLLAKIIYINVYNISQQLAIKFLFSHQKYAF